MFANSPFNKHLKQAIYRGPGGSGDATADASSTAALAQQYANNAANSASLANTAKIAAELAETNAETAETNAEAAQLAAENARDDILNDAGFIAVAADLAGPDNIGTVAADITNVNAVGSNIAAVIAVDANETNINTVASDLAGADNIGTVAGSITDVNAVGQNIAEVVAVGTDLLGADNIGTVAADLSGADNIGTVAGIATEVVTVAGISTEIVAVEANETNINTVAADLAGADNISTVAGSITDVNSVGQNITDVSTVATDITNVNTVAGDITNVNAVAGNAANINAVAGNETNINAVAGNATNINAVAGNEININTVASVSGDVTTVASVSTDVTTVAGISTNVTTVAGNTTNINTVATNNTNITTVATNIADVNTVATNIATIADKVNKSGDTMTGQLNVPTLDATNIEVTNVKAKDGTAAIVITDSTGAVTVSTLLNVDNVRVDGNTISSTNTNGNIAITPNGTGEVDITKVDIDSGTIDATTIGGTTPAAGNFTVIQADYIYAKNLPSVGSFTWDTATTSPAASVSDVGARVITSIHSGMRRCVINDSGVVQYYLSATDSTKKADGANSNLTGADGQVMVEIPKFYTKREVNGTQIVWSISAIPLTGFTIHPAFIKNGVEVNYRYYSAYDACFEIDRTITAVADAGGGNITITATGHALYAGDVITIAGTTSYNGTFTVVTRTDANNFTVTATFVATETGTFKAYLSGLNFDNNATAGRSIGTTSATKLASISGIFPAVGLTRGEFRTIAANRGTGWRQLDWTLFSAIQLLYLIEYQTFFSQNVLGNGNTGTTYATTAADPTQAGNGGSVAGKSDSLGNASTDTTSGASSASRAVAYMSYRGIENFYGNEWNWADGCIVNPDGTVSAGQGDWWFTNNSADFSDSVRTNMTQIMSNAPTGSGYVSAISGVDNFFIATSTSGGSTTTYLTDQYFGSTGADRVVSVGGSAGDGASAGAFVVFANDVSSRRSRSFGARLAF